jgi:hypothetical protein
MNKLAWWRNDEEISRLEKARKRGSLKSVIEEAEE